MPAYIFTLPAGAKTNDDSRIPNINTGITLAPNEKLVSIRMEAISTLGLKAKTSDFFPNGAVQFIFSYSTQIANWQYNGPNRITIYPIASSPIINVSSSTVSWSGSSDSQKYGINIKMRVTCATYTGSAWRGYAYDDAVELLNPVTFIFYTEYDAPTNSGRYNGSSWGKVIPLRYNGSSWVECELKRYNGSSWTNVDTK